MLERRDRVPRVTLKSSPFQITCLEKEASHGRKASGGQEVHCQHHRFMIQLQNTADLRLGMYSFFYANHTGLRAYESKTSISTVSLLLLFLTIEAPANWLVGVWWSDSSLLVTQSQKTYSFMEDIPLVTAHPASCCCSPSAFYLPLPSPHPCHPQTSRSGPFCKVHKLLHYFFH